MSGPLAGVRIIDLSSVVSGPLTTALLADQGAEVIKVERPSGDVQRHVGSQRNGMSGSFHMLNRGKRSVVADLATEGGRKVVRALLREADAVVENYRPGALVKHGLGWEALHELNPRLVYLSITGFGESGPHADRRSYDPIIQARSGMAAAQGQARGEGPEQVQQLLADKVTAYTAAQALTAALFARERTGVGQKVSVSMLDSAIAFVWPDAGADQILLGAGVDHRPPLKAAGHLASYADGWATTMALSDHEYQGLCKAFDVPELATDERFNTLPTRYRNRDLWEEVLHTTFADRARVRSLDEVERRCVEHHVPFGRVNTVADLADDPQVQHNQTLRVIEHPVAGALLEARPAALFSGTPASPGRPAPALGEHTGEVLAELARGEIESFS